MNHSPDDSKVLTKTKVRQTEPYLISHTINQKGKESDQSTRLFVEKTKAKKWAWTHEAVELLLKYIKEYKTKYKFNISLLAEINPKDNPTHVKEGYLLPFIEG